MSGNLRAVRKAKYLVIGPLVSYNRGILARRITILGFNNEKGGDEKQYAC